MKYMKYINLFISILGASVFVVNIFINEYWWALAHIILAVLSLAIFAFITEHENN